MAWNPGIRTTTVGSYPVPDWLVALPTEQAVVDATRVVVQTQRQAGIDLPTDGELSRFDPNHPDTNGMIDSFIRPLRGVRANVGYSDWEAFRRQHDTAFRAKPAGVVEDAVGEGGLNLVADCRRIADAVGTDFKFTITSPYMLARTLLDHHCRDLESLTMALADVLAPQVAALECACVQIDEAHVTGHPEHATLAAAAINRLLDAACVERAVHLCFGNYGGQTIQKGTWRALVAFLNDLHVDHLILECAHRPEADLSALVDVRADIRLGIGVVDVKVNTVETPDEVAERIEKAAGVLGVKRIAWVHPDCGLWMLKRSVADRKIRTLVQGRDRFLGID